MARALSLTHAGCLAHVRRKFEEARKVQASPNSTDSHAKAALNFIRELYLIERALWDKEQPVSADHRVRVRAELSAPVVERSHDWLMTLAPQVLPQSLLGKAVHYTLRSVVEAHDVPRAR